MRLRIRKQFRDVRNNAVVGKALWDFIDSIIGPSGLEVLDAENAALTNGSRKRRYEDDDE